MRLFVPACCAAALSVAAIFGATASGSQGLHKPPSRVAYLPNYGDSSISDVRLRGSVRNIDYSIAGALTDAHIIFDISLAGRSVQVRLRKEDFPEIDLRTIREGVASETEPDTLRFSVEFSELGGCFDAVTTPKRLVMQFNVEGLIAGSWITAEGCALVWHQLNLVRTAPNVYSAAIED